MFLGISCYYYWVFLCISWYFLLFLNISWYFLGVFLRISSRHECSNFRPCTVSGSRTSRYEYNLFETSTLSGSNVSTRVLEFSARHCVGILEIPIRVQLIRYQFHKITSAENHNTMSLIIVRIYKRWLPKGCHRTKKKQIFINSRKRAI